MKRGKVEVSEETKENYRESIEEGKNFLRHAAIQKLIRAFFRLLKELKF